MTNEGATLPQAPVFHLLRNGNPLRSLQLAPAGTFASLSANPPVLSEVQPIGFQVEAREPDTEYAVRVGDIPLSAQTTVDDDQDRVRALAFGRSVIWGDHPYLESTRGLVRVFLLSRLLPADGPWRTRAELTAFVLPTKLGEDRYHTMFTDLRHLSLSLVLDLVSKTTRSIGYGDAMPGMSIRTSDMELRAVDTLWTSFTRALGSLLSDPVLSLRPFRETRASWGSERLSQRSLGVLVRRGADPRHPSTARPFPAIQERLRESRDTIEHRIILGFLALLVGRVHDCLQSIGTHIDSIEGDRPYRDQRLGPGPTLYEQYDRPRLERLREVQDHARHLVRAIHRAELSPLFRGLLPLYRPPRTPVFDHVPAYRRVQQIISRYLRSSLSLLDEHADERSKSTSRMYEQWVFLQLAAAFRALGLESEDIQGLLRRSAAQRFTLDFPRDTRLLLRAPNGRLLSMRYEPWVFPAHAARSRGDTIYRGQTGEAPWSPDILLELLSRDDGGRAHTEYAIVVDAKYSHRVNWAGADKYLQIRATSTDRQVVRQVWLAHPIADLGIVFRDQAIEWNEGGPNRPKDETIQGAIGFVPRQSTDEDGTGELRGFEVTGTVLDFSRGLLSYLGLRADVDAGSPSSA